MVIKFAHDLKRLLLLRVSVFKCVQNVVFLRKKDDDDDDGDGGSDVRFGAPGLCSTQPLRVFQVGGQEGVEGRSTA